jgi:uncharacterized protein (DUF2267 family)
LIYTLDAERLLPKVPVTKYQTQRDSERTSRGQRAEQPCDQLPLETADPLRGEDGRDSFSLAEFYRRIADKEGVEEPEAIRHARAVATVTEEAVTTGERGHVRD